MSTVSAIIELINNTEITEMESQEIARAALAKNSVPATIWSTEDIISQITDRAEDEFQREFTAEERERIVDLVRTSRTWRTTLADTTEDQWDSLDQEIDTAINSL